MAGGAGARAAAGGGVTPTSELEGLVGELQACDPRALEMAGIEVSRNGRGTFFVPFFPPLTPCGRSLINIASNPKTA